jgi:hypothetical protein
MRGDRMAVFVVVAILGSAAITLVGFVTYLAFCAFVVICTGGTSGLQDVAEAIRAFASIGSLSPTVSLEIRSSANRRARSANSGEGSQGKGAELLHSDQYGAAAGTDTSAGARADAAAGGGTALSRARRRHPAVRL